MHMQLRLAFFIGKDCSYSTGFMDTFQESHHWLRRHCVTVFGSHDYFALVLGTA